MNDRQRDEREGNWRRGRRDDDRRPYVGQNERNDVRVRRPTDVEYGNGHGIDSSRPREPRRLGYKGLEALLEVDPAQLVFKLSSSQSGFVELLRHTDIRRDLMVMIINLLSRACQSHVAPQSLVKLLNITYERSDFVTRHLTQYVTKMQLEYELKYLSIIPKQIQDISVILMTMLQRLPRSSDAVIVVVMLLQTTVPPLENKCGELDKDTKNTLRRLVEYHQEMKRNAEKTKNESQHQKQVGSIGPPPDNFRELSIFPGIEDLNTDVEPYLRQNIVHGGYTDVDHYLDVQFRLLREDFIKPLRTGISEYQRMKAAKPGQHHQRPKDIRIYKDVQIQYPMCSKDGIIYRVHFDQTRFQRVRWQATKRLIYGSLVCLSNDDFQTLLFATVANRNPDDLEQGYVDIRFENREVTENSKADLFVMAESSAYFEGYRHVLKGLQDVTPDTLCFQKHLIQVAKDVDAPEYIRQKPDVTYDLSPLVSVSHQSEDSKKENEDELTLASVTVQIMDIPSWPFAEDLHLDNSQLEAVQMALTNELAVIQGPPGTGKTYIGLKITQALLHNSHVWSNEADANVERTRPILVVCFTNHALDQFLEGILKFQKTGIVRIGGRSTSEALKSCNLNSLKQEIRKRREVLSYIFETNRELVAEMTRCRQPMEEAQSRINMTRHAILNEDHLCPYMESDQYNSLVDLCPFPPNRIAYRIGIMLIWLGLEGTTLFVTPKENDQYIDMEEVNNTGEDDDDDDLQIDEEARLIEEQRTLDDQDVSDTQIYSKGFDINIIRKEFALDVEAMNTEESDSTDEHGWNLVKMRKSRMRRLIKRNLGANDTMSKFEAERIKNVWTIPDMKNRWRLYRYWMKAYCERQERLLFEKQGEYEQLTVQLKEVRTEEDLTILNRAKVIGLTTTGAAKYRSLLQRVKSRIVIVEEAAEVMESHVITTLSSDCQQLILIGDHQQLRPNPTVYKLAKDFKLDISLFERMVNNGLPCARLTQQHRMRPEISCIMKLRHFYPNLQDHFSVKHFENIKGMKSNLFFIDHNNLENYIDDTKSHSNQHEADFLISLSRYFLQQGYAPSQITILTTYTGQLFTFKNSLKQYTTFKAMKDIRVCAVDNFQGEENDIILLSLVRSNEEGSIGFLKVANRVCVALSRARKGLFCIGNFNLLTSKGQLWQDIVTEMKANQSFGTGLKLVCPNHPYMTTDVSTADDFLNVPEGGCNKPCEARLTCGHACLKLCHPLDSEHEEYRCLKKCDKPISGCPRGHRCAKSCFQECEQICTTLIEQDLSCGHRVAVPCQKDTRLVVCPLPCSYSLQCGHQCQNKCGERCATSCEVLVRHEEWSCKHAPELPCSANPEDCSHPCDTTLLCEHTCSGTCGECQRGRLHSPCTNECNRILVCGHLCEEPCTSTCPPCQKPCENRCIHSKCQSKCGNPCVPCQEPCAWLCKHVTCTMTCGDPCNRGPCDEPCGKRLRKCRHPCIGLCGEPCPTKCRICDKEEVTEILFGSEDEPDARFVQLEDCGHVIEAGALDNWMKMDNQSKTRQEVNIQLKACPKCKTAIRRNLRYGNMIKQMLSDIEAVKKRVFGDEADIQKKKHELLSQITACEKNGKMNRDTWMYMNDQLSSRLTLEQITLIENQFNRVLMIHILRKKAGEGIKHSEKQSKKRSIEQQLTALEQWLIQPRPRMSEQELEDVSRELERLSLICQMVTIECKALDQGRWNSLNVQTDLHMVKSLLTDGFPLTDERTTEAQRLLKRLVKMIGGLSISNEERVGIVTAMGLSKGHWFKCPNGHIYAIGDCGGATVEGRCPECKSTIGGTGYTLTSGNRFAPEMDNASYPAWSDQANMAI